MHYTTHTRAKAAPYQCDDQKPWRPLQGEGSDQHGDLHCRSLTLPLVASQELKCSIAQIMITRARYIGTVMPWEWLRLLPRTGILCSHCSPSRATTMGKTQRKMSNARNTVCFLALIFSIAFGPHMPHANDCHCHVVFVFSVTTTIIVQ